MSRRMIHVFVLFCVLLVGLLVSCGGENDNSGDGNNPGGDDDIDNDDDIDDDDDVDDDDDNYDDDDFDDDIVYGDVVMERVEGGQIGVYGIAAAIDGSDRIYVATTRARSLVVYAGDGSGEWSEEVVDVLAEYTRMAVDPAGNLHLLYRQPIEQTQAYATNVSGAWEIVAMDPGRDCLAIAADSAGQAHMACVEGGNLVHVTGNVDGWEYETVDESGDVTPNAAIVIDENDSVHLAYTVYDRVHYAAKNEGDWAIENVSDTLDDALAVDLALDSAGIPHVVYEVYIDEGYYYSYYEYHYGKRLESGDWTNETIDYYGKRDNDNPGSSNRDKADLAADEPQFLAIAVDSEDLPYVVINEDFCERGWYCWSFGLDAYYEWVNGVDLVFNSADVAYLVYGAGTQEGYAAYDGKDYVAVASSTDLWDWDKETLESISWTSWGSTIAQGADGALQIALYDGTDLKHAIRSADEWQVSTVFSCSRGFDYQPDLAVDADGAAHISFGAGEYWDDLQVGYATNADGSWSSDLLEPGSDTSIALDPDEQPAIAFMEWEWLDTNVRYGILGPGGWDSWLVEEDKSPGTPGALAFDTDGIAHMCYTQYVTNPGLYHAWGNEDEWNVETIVHEYTPNCSIRLDSEDFVHVLYTSDDSNQLVYATNKSGTWTLHVVEHDWVFGSFAIDADGIYVVWHRYEPPVMYYTTNISGEWMTYVLDRGAGVGGYTSLTLGSDDRLHASHYGYGGIWHVSFPKELEN